MTEEEKRPGRPLIGKEPRVPMNDLVKPSTKALLSAWGSLPGLSRGQVIDELVEARKAKLDYDSQG